MLKAIPLLFIIIVLFALPTLDPDFGWIYRCGRTDCSVNTFSVFLPGFHWTRPMVIYPKIIAFIFNRFSFNGLTILNIILGLSSFFFFHKIIKTSLTVSSAAFIASTLLSFPVLNLGLRNQSLSLPFFLATIYFLTEKRYKFLPILFLIWANTHPSFPIGLAIVGFYVITHPAEAAAGGLIAGLATLLNPSGLNIYQDIFSHFQIPMNTLVAEWVKPPAFITFLIIASTITLLFVKKTSLFNIFSLVLFSIFSLTAIRNLPYFYFLFPLIAFSGMKKIPFEKIISLLWLPVLIFLASSIIPKTIDINTNWNSYCSKGITNFPCEAVEFLKNKPPGNIFHTYEWGGFLIWQLPEFKTFVDGRMPAWRLVPSEVEGPAVSPYSLYLATYQTLPGWQETLEKYKIDYILISPGTFLDLELKKNIYPWKEIFKSQYSVLYKK